VGIELVHENAIEKWKALIGPADAPKGSNTLRGMFGTDPMRNAVHGSESAGQFKKEVDQFFSKQTKTTALLNNCTLCIIKPHIVKAGQAGEIVDIILGEGFEISAMELFTLDRPSSEEFFDVYKGVLPEYIPIIENMSSGPCLALEVR